MTLSLDWMAAMFRFTEVETACLEECEDHTYVATSSFPEVTDYFIYVVALKQTEPNKDRFWVVKVSI